MSLLLPSNRTSTQLAQIWTTFAFPEPSGDLLHGNAPRRDAQDELDDLVRPYPQRPAVLLKEPVPSPLAEEQGESWDGV